MWDGRVQECFSVFPLFGVVWIASTLSGRLWFWPPCSGQAYLENNIGVAKLLSGELNEGALHVAKAATLEPGVPAFAHNVHLLREMADSWSIRRFYLMPSLVLSSNI